MLTLVSARACVVSVIRFQFLRLSATSPDKTWDSYFSAIYGVIEPNVGIVCACIVTLRPLFRRWKWLQSDQAESSTRVELPERPRFRHGIHGSGQILSTNDEEAGQGGITSFVLPSDSKKDLVLSSSTATEKDDITETTAVGSRGSGGGHEAEVKSSV